MAVWLPLAGGLIAARPSPLRRYKVRLCGEFRSNRRYGHNARNSKGRFCIQQRSYIMIKPQGRWSLRYRRHNICLLYKSSVTTGLCLVHLLTSIQQTPLLNSNENRMSLIIIIIRWRLKIYISSYRTNWINYWKFDEIILSHKCDIKYIRIDIYVMIILYSQQPTIVTEEIDT